MKPSAMFMDKNTSNRDKFGAWLRASRNDYGLTVRELANQLGVSPAYISDIENGNRRAPIKHLEKIAKIFNLPEQELMYLTDLAGCSHGNHKDINEYLGSSPKAREAMRAAKNADLSDEEFLKIFLQVLDDAQRKDFIDEILYLAGDDKEGCLEWLSSLLNEEQIDAYIALTNQANEPEEIIEQSQKQN